MARIPASCRSSLNVPRIQGNDGWQYAVFPPRRSGLAPFAPRHRKTYQIPAFAASGFRSGTTLKLAATPGLLTRRVRDGHAPPGAQAFESHAESAEPCSARRSSDESHAESAEPCAALRSSV